MSIFCSVVAHQPSNCIRISNVYTWNEWSSLRAKKQHWAFLRFQNEMNEEKNTTTQIYFPCTSIHNYVSFVSGFFFSFVSSFCRRQGSFWHWCWRSGVASFILKASQWWRQRRQEIAFARRRKNKQIQMRWNAHAVDIVLPVYTFCSKLINK